MKLRNKKTGEIGELSIWHRADNNEITGFAVIKENEKFPTDYKNLAELNEEWEDYEEPKEYWYIYADKPQRADCGDILEEDFKAIGNHFEAKEEAEKAVEKLKAWKRLKDKGFKFVEHQIHGLTEDGEGDGCAYFEFDKQLDKSDLDLLFGGEE